jgi:hypothetical protein
MRKKTKKILRMKRANEETVLGISPTVAYSETGVGILQNSLFGGFLFAMSKVKGTLIERAFLMPFALLLDGMRLIMAWYEWFNAKSKNLTRTAKALFELVKFSAVCVGIVGVLSGVAVIAALTPYIFFGAMIGGTVFNTLFAIRARARVKRLEKEKIQCELETKPFLREKELHKYKMDYQERTHATLISAGLAVAFGVILTFAPVVTVVTKIASFSTAIIMGMNALWTGWMGRRFAKSRQKQVAEDKAVENTQPVASSRAKGLQPQYHAIPQRINTRRYIERRKQQTFFARGRSENFDIKGETASSLLRLDYEDLSVLMEKQGGIEEQRTFLITLITAKMLQLRKAIVPDNSLLLIEQIEKSKNRTRPMNKYLALYYLKQLIDNNSVQVICSDGKPQVIGGVNHSLLESWQQLQKFFDKNNMTGWRNGVDFSFFQDVSNTSNLFLTANHFAANVEQAKLAAKERYQMNISLKI